MSNLRISKVINQPNSAKKPSTPNTPNTPNSLYSGIPSAQRAIQQQRYFGSASGWRSAQSKRPVTSAVPTKTCEVELNYHPWELKYNKIITRDKHLKSMTKDSYTPTGRLMTSAVERVTTEAECCLTLIPAKAVKIQTYDTQQSARRSFPTIVRYLRRDELMPSERPALPSYPVKVTLLSQIDYNKSIISVTNISKITGVVPTSAATDRLLNRAKVRIDTPVIRRPPRKLLMNVSRRTVMPLSVFG